MERLTEWAEGCFGKAGDVDGPPYAGAVGVGGSGDLATDSGVGSVGKDSLVGDAGGVVADDGSVAEFASGL
jgi:hypothetical protein